MASGRFLTFWGVFLHVNRHVGFGECRCVVVYVFYFYVKRQLHVQLLLGGFVKDVKLDLLTQLYIKSFSNNSNCWKHIIRKTNSKFAYMEDVLILLSVNTSMGNDFSCFGIYAEHVFWIFIYSSTTYAELEVCPRKVVIHLAPAQKPSY